MVEFIIPKSIFNTGEFARLAAANTVATGQAVKRDYESTVKTWDHKPTFTITTSKDSVTVSTDDKNYQGVDEGVPPHTIVPRRARKLKFARDYKAKTQPGVIGSKSGGKSGQVVTAKIVRHPGMQARGFTKAIKAKNDKLFIQRGINAVVSANK